MTRTPRLTMAALIGLVALWQRRSRRSAHVIAVLGRDNGEPDGAGLARLRNSEHLGPSSRLWSGFAIFGWGYFFLAFCSPFRDVVRPHMLTSVAIVESYRYVHPQVRLQPIDLAQLPAAGKPLSMVPHSISFLQHMPAPSSSQSPEVVPCRSSPSVAMAQPSHPALTCSILSSARLTPRSRSVFAGLGGLFAAFAAHRAATTSTDGRTGGRTDVNRQ